MLLDFSTYESPEQHCKPLTAFDEDVLQFLQLWRTQKEFSVQTSGSTGTPKTITHRKECMQNSAKMTGEFFGFQKGQTALLCLPVNKIAGIMMLVRAVVWQLKLYTLPPKLQLNLMKLPSIDFAPLLPAQAIENFEQLNKINTILLGGVGVSPSLFEQISTHKSHFFLSYGMTETISHIAICDLQKEGNNYEVLPDIAISSNENDCLGISAPQLGISNLQTNDIVQLTSSKTFRFLGRFDNIINSGGLKIIAEEIEKQIAPYISQNFYIAGTKDKKLGEKATLFIESKTWNEEKLESLKERLRNITPKQAIPKEIIFQKQFEYTLTGKTVKIQQ